MADFILTTTALSSYLYLVVIVLSSYYSTGLFCLHVYDTCVHCFILYVAFAHLEGKLLHEYKMCPVMPRSSVTSTVLIPT